MKRIKDTQSGLMLLMQGFQILRITGRGHFKALSGNGLPRLVCILITIAFAGMTTLSGCSSPADTSHGSNQAMDSVLPPDSNIVNSMDSEDTAQVTINKVEFSMTEKITLTFTGRRFKQFGISDPASRFYYIASDTFSTAIPPVMSSTDFQAIPGLEIDIKTFRAFPYDIAAREQSVVFGQPGVYKLIFGDNLESEEMESKIITVKIN